MDIKSIHSFANLRAPKREIHYLDVPHGFVSGMAKGNIAHQMRYSVDLLEQTLRSEGRYFLLQLKMDFTGEGASCPSSWELFANGRCIASGDDGFAKECFYDSAETFMKVCREAIEASNVESLTPEEFKIASIACKAIAVDSAECCAY